MQKRCFVSLALMLSMTTISRGQTNTERGATLGGVAGAIAGGIIGHQNNETPEGVLIGGAVGAIAGGVLGRSKDTQIREQQYQQQIWHQQQALARQSQQQYYVQNAPVSMSDVASMSRSGVGDSLIVNQIRKNGVQQVLTTQDIISLTRQGVSEQVIIAMQQTGVVAPTSIPIAMVATRMTPPPPPRPQTVIVHQEYVVPRPTPVYRYTNRVHYPSRPPHYHGRSYRRY